MRRVFRSRRKAVQGQALVEFALTSLIFLTTILAIFEGGRVAVSYADLAYAIEEGGRSAALPAPETNSTTDVCNRIAARAKVITIPCSSVTINSGGSFTSRATGGKVSVTGTYLFVPVLSSIFGGRLSVNLSYTAVFYVE